MVRGEIDKERNNLRPDNVWPDMWKHVSDAARSEAKQKLSIEKPELDNAGILRDIFFIEPNNEEYKHTMNNACRKLEIQMPAATPFKTPAKCRGETCRTIGKRKAKYACIVDADESI